MKKTYHTPIIENKDFEYNTDIALIPSQSNLDSNLANGESDMWEDI